VAAQWYQGIGGEWLKSKQLLILGLFFIGAGLAQAQDTAEEPVEDEPQLTEASFEILIVDITQVRSSAAAYISIQQETERVRDLVNDLYQERLNSLETNRDDVLSREELLPPDEFRSQIAALEEEAIDLEASRRQNYTRLERRRQEAIAQVDRRLNEILAELLVQSGAAYVLNQQSALVWPEAANVTQQAIILLDQRIPFVNFEITPPEGQGLPEGQGG